MNDLTKRYRFKLLTVLLLASLNAAAQTEHERLEAGWNQTYELLDGVLTPQQQSGLNSLAYSAAVANLCQGFELDKDKFSQGMAQLEHAHKADMSAPEINYFGQHMMFNYGVHVGLFLAEGSLDSTGFCQNAQRERDEHSPAEHYWR